LFGVRSHFLFPSSPGVMVLRLFFLLFLDLPLFFRRESPPSFYSGGEVCELVLLFPPRFWEMYLGGPPSFFFLRQKKYSFPSPPMFESQEPLFPPRISVLPVSKTTIFCLLGCDARAFFFFSLKQARSGTVLAPTEPESPLLSFPFSLKGP